MTILHLSIFAPKVHIRIRYNMLRCFSPTRWGTHSCSQYFKCYYIIGHLQVDIVSPVGIAVLAINIHSLINRLWYFNSILVPTIRRQFHDRYHVILHTQQLVLDLIPSVTLGLSIDWINHSIEQIASNQ